MLAERSVSVEHTTLYHWVQHYVHEIEKRLRWYWCQPSGSCSGHPDKTYIKVKENRLICTSQSTADTVPLIFISRHAATVKPHTALWGSS